jgi:hypothetical protein
MKTETKKTETKTSTRPVTKPNQDDLKVKALLASKPLPVVAKVAGKTAKVKPEPKRVVAATTKETVSIMARRLINAGKTNEEVLTELGKHFTPADDYAVGGKKRHYACWYRAALARVGELSPKAKAVK